MSEYPSNNTEFIKNSVNYKINKGINSINSALNKNINRINSEIKKVPAKYNQLRNNLTLSNEQNKKRTEEYIANTGNHTASGYAMSKRLNNQNAYNKEMNNINLSEQNEIAELRDKITDLTLNAESEKNKLMSDSADKGLELYLSEAARIDNLNETKRVNDANIEKINSGIAIDQAKNLREQQVHDIELKYLDEEHQAGIENKKADTALTNSKIQTETSKKAQLEAQTSKIKSGSSSGGSGSSKSSALLSKMTPAQLADNINKQTGTLKYDSSGKASYIVNPLKAYTLLMEWKKKFNLSNQVVNDTAIHLGVQSYL